MKRLFILFLLVFATFFVPAQSVQAQGCTSNCYWATGVYIKNSDGSPYTGNMRIEVDGFADRYEHFTSGVNDSGYVWSGYVAGTWSPIEFRAIKNNVLEGKKKLQNAYASPPLIPDIVVIKLD